MNMSAKTILAVALYLHWNWHEGSGFADAQVNVTLIATGFGDGADVAGLGPQNQLKSYAAPQPAAHHSEPEFAAAGPGRSHGGGVEIPAFLRKRRERGR